MEAMELLLGRSSAVLLTGPAPSAEAIEKMIGSAVLAPDHGRQRPWKFLVINEDKRAKFGDLLAESVKRKQPDASPEMLQRERDKAMRAPTILVAAFTPKSPSKIPEVEQLLAVGAATQNIMLAAHAMGLGAMWKTGDAAYDNDVKVALGLQPTDQIVGFIYVGTRSQPANLPPPRPRAQAKDFIAQWQG
jgi:nitroreductase